MNKQVELLLRLEEIEKKKLGREEKRALVEKLENEIGEDLVRYYRLRQSRSGTALAPILNGVCLGCGMHYPDTNRVIQKLDIEVVRCEFCGRIVYPAPADYRIPEKPRKKEPAPAVASTPRLPAAPPAPIAVTATAPAPPAPKRAASTKKKPSRAASGARKRPAVRKTIRAAGKKTAKEKAGRRAAPPRKRVQRTAQKSSAGKRVKRVAKARASGKKAARRK